ncbi:hypothetical protein Q5O14_09030 [Eubacteriaceae bacterium ES2]|nr:hypothetical protein Q5O14_09030 [Eubacteriaceae bacterium ES2]
MRSLDEIKSIIEPGGCDFVSMARPFITEPDLVNKMKTGLHLASKCYYGKLPK